MKITGFVDGAADGIREQNDSGLMRLEPKNDVQHGRGYNPIALICDEARKLNI
jgi:hypothetical protein